MLTALYMFTTSVTCSMKLNNTATPAYREKERTAGIEEMAPRRKAADSEDDVSRRLGATSASARPMR